MAFLLGKGSAVEWLRMATDSQLGEQFVLPLLSLEGSRTRLQRHPQLLDALSTPLHLIVSTRENRRPSTQATCHLLISPTDYYPALLIERGAFCSTPAFTFLQMASELDREALLMLGMELCGRYGIDDTGTLFLRRQTCTPEQLFTHAGTMSRVHGRSQALATAPFVVGNSASPMESALTLILSQPLELGGFGLPAPALNRKIPLGGQARLLWDDDFIRPDLLWEDGMTVLEYDSDQEHASSRRRARDSSRRNVFAELGYRVISVNAEHLRTPRELERIAGIVARQHGFELPERDEALWKQQVAFQLRIRNLAEHPELLLAFGDGSLRKHQSWHVRSPEEASRTFPL